MKNNNVFKYIDMDEKIDNNINCFSKKIEELENNFIKFCEKDFRVDNENYSDLMKKCIENIKSNIQDLNYYISSIEDIMNMYVVNNPIGDTIEKTPNKTIEDIESEFMNILVTNYKINIFTSITSIAPKYIIEVDIKNNENTDIKKDLSNAIFKNAMVASSIKGKPIFFDKKINLDYFIFEKNIRINGEIFPATADLVKIINSIDEDMSLENIIETFYDDNILFKEKEENNDKYLDKYFNIKHKKSINDRIVRSQVSIFGKAGLKMSTEEKNRGCSWVQDSLDKTLYHLVEREENYL